MPRKPRILVKNGFYHIMARGNNRLFIFNVPEGFDKFKELLGQSKIKYSWRLFHYCLMSNHVHLLGQMIDGKVLPKLMQFLLFEYSRWYRKQNDYVGHIWQGRYKSKLIKNESYFLECGRYIERNPVRAKIVLRPEEYQWSSCQHYALSRQDSLIDNNPYYDCLDSNIEVRQKWYQKYVSLEGPYDEVLDENLLEAYF